REREHGLSAERHHDRARRERPQLSRADELERQLALVDAQLRLGERAAYEWQRVQRAQQADVPVLPGEQKLRPRRATLLVVGPLHLVEDEHLTVSRRHLDGAAQHRGVLVDPLLARDQPDLFLAEQGREPAVRLLRQHPQRAGVDAAPLLGEECQRVVCLAGVRRPEVRDDALGLSPPLGESDLDPTLGALHGRALVGTGGPCVPCGPGRSPRRTRTATAGHRATVAARRPEAVAATNVWGAPALHGTYPAVRRGSSRETRSDLEVPA